MNTEKRTCTTCGKLDIALEAHNIVPRSLGGLDIPGNIVMICGECHGKIHNTRRSLDLSSLIKRGQSKSNKRLGPPIKVTADVIDKARELREQGLPYSKIAGELGLSVGAVHKCLK